MGIHPMKFLQQTHNIRIICIQQNNIWSKYHALAQGILGIPETGHQGDGFCFPNYVGKLLQIKAVALHQHDVVVNH